MVSFTYNFIRREAYVQKNYGIHYCGGNYTDIYRMCRQGDLKRKNAGRKNTDGGRNLQNSGEKESGRNNHGYEH